MLMFMSVPAFYDTLPGVFDKGSVTFFYQLCQLQDTLIQKDRNPFGHRLKR